MMTVALSLGDRIKTLLLFEYLHNQSKSTSNSGKASKTKQVETVII